MLFELLEGGKRGLSNIGVFCASFLIFLFACTLPLIVAFAKAFGHVYRILLWSFGVAFFTSYFYAAPHALYIATILLIVAAVLVSLNMEGLALWKKAMGLIAPAKRKDACVTKWGEVKRSALSSQWFSKLLVPVRWLMRILFYLFSFLAPAVKALSMSVGVFFLVIPLSFLPLGVFSGDAFLNFSSSTVTWSLVFLALAFVTVFFLHYVKEGRLLRARALEDDSQDTGCLSLKDTRLARFLAFTIPVLGALFKGIGYAFGVQTFVVLLLGSTVSFVNFLPIWLLVFSSVFLVTLQMEGEAVNRFFMKPNESATKADQHFKDRYRRSLLKAFGAGNSIWRLLFCFLVTSANALSKGLTMMAGTFVMLHWFGLAGPILWSIASVCGVAALCISLTKECSHFTSKCLAYAPEQFKVVKAGEDSVQSLELVGDALSVNETDVTLEIPSRIEAEEYLGFNWLVETLQPNAAPQN